MTKTGTVYLVGSGPGAAGLMTLRSVELLGRADVVVFDKLAGWNFLAHIRSGIELIDVGKQANRHTLPQDQINQLLVDLAKQGKNVVRLKGGDPYVFGRGGEEAEVLVAHNIPFEEVPGITSSIAVPAAAGIPVTHRDHCTSFHVITGHERSDREASALDFSVLAKIPGTLVFLMGMRNLEQNAQELIVHGKAATTPVAVIERGCTARQRTVHGTLQDIAELVNAANLQPPAVTVVGAVVDLAKVLAEPIGQYPLRGKSVLVTRTRQQAGRFSAKLREQGAEVIEIPLLRIERNPDEGLWESFLQELPGMDWLVLTSENGVEFLLEKMREVHMDVRDLVGVKIAAVGPATANRLEQYGLRAEIVPNVYTVSSLVATLREHLQAGDHIALARADIADPTVAEQLRAMDCEVLDVPIYFTRSELTYKDFLMEILTEGHLDWISFASSSTVKSFDAVISSERSCLGNTRIVSIGPVTSATLRELGYAVAVEAKVHTLDGMVSAIQEASL